MTFLLDLIFVIISNLFSGIVSVPVTVLTEFLVSIFTPTV